MIRNEAFLNLPVRVINCKSLEQLAGSEKSLRDRGLGQACKFGMVTDGSAATLGNRDWDTTSLGRLGQWDGCGKEGKGEKDKGVREIHGRKEWKGICWLLKERKKTTDDLEGQGKAFISDRWRFRYMGGTYALSGLKGAACLVGEKDGKPSSLCTRSAHQSSINSRTASTTRHLGGLLTCSLSVGRIREVGST